MKIMASWSSQKGKKKSISSVLSITRSRNGSCKGRDKAAIALARLFMARLAGNENKRTGKSAFPIRWLSSGDPLFSGFDDSKRTGHLLQSIRRGMFSWPEIWFNPNEKHPF
ncbi:hypothetical protein Bca52824_064353 [Brassica carinata]|uniref:Uncharacterized protein n=1 Tax=Brassica carinata TaxID=52824 RepID=A0A8X7QHB6_BRACI|nr:hypothetical protein Bca52824_064353 [Brassica carinata]